MVVNPCVKTYDSLNPCDVLIISCFTIYENAIATFGSKVTYVLFDLVSWVMVEERLPQKYNLLGAGFGWTFRNIQDWVRNLEKSKSLANSG